MVEVRFSIRRPLHKGRGMDSMEGRRRGDHRRAGMGMGDIKSFVFELPVSA